MVQAASEGETPRSRERGSVVPAVWPDGEERGRVDGGVRVQRFKCVSGLVGRRCWEYDCMARYEGLG